MSYPNKFNNYKKKSYNNNNKFNYVNKSNMPYPNYSNNFNYNLNYYNNFNTNNNYNDNFGTSMNTSYKLLFWNILCNEYSYGWKTSPKKELKYKVGNTVLNYLPKFFPIKIFFRIFIAL